MNVNLYVMIPRISHQGIAIEAILLRTISKNVYSRDDESRALSFDEGLTSLRNSPSTGNLVAAFGEGEQEISIAV